LPPFRGALLDENTGAAIADWVNGGNPVDHALELVRKAAFAAAAGTQAFTKWWNSASVRPRRKALRPDLDNLASITRAADEKMARERQAEAAARRHQADVALLDDPFANRPARGNAASDRSVILKSLNDVRQYGAGV
jgi:hypothetical protein